MNTLAGAGPQGQQIATVIWVFLAVCAAIYLATLIALGWALLRRSREDDHSQRVSHRITVVVVAATAFTAATLVVLTTASEVAGRGLRQPSGPGAVTIDVIGHQWFWNFRYRGATGSEWVSSPNELHIPVGVPVVLNTISRDVIHSFWVPALHGKRDLIPGVVTQTWIQADTPGMYPGRCAEFCGHQHANMAFTVVAEPASDFQIWLDRQRQPAIAPTEDTRRGHDLFMSRTCVTCHAIRGTQAGSRVGPDLTHVGSRRTIAAGTLANTPDQLARWLRDPQAIKPGTRMPATPLTDDELRSVVAYLGSLR